MANRNSSLFEDLASSAAVSERKRSKETSKNKYLSDRKNTLSNLVNGGLEEKTLLWVDPKVCRMWEHHNRRYDLLNEQRCRDLIDGFKSQGKQEFPAIVRKVEDAEHQYEVVCGARRHWTVSYLRENNYPHFKFLIEVRELSDEEAFRVSDVENRDRSDISDYERAVDYARAVKLFYGSQKKMAERLEVSQAWLSRYLDLSKIPNDVVDLFSDVSFLTIERGRKLKPWLSDPKKFSVLKKRIESLYASPSSNSDKEILSQLTQSVNHSANRVEVKNYKLEGSNKDAVKLKLDPNGNVSLSIMPVSVDQKRAVKELVTNILDDIFN